MHAKFHERALRELVEKHKESGGRWYKRHEQQEEHRKQLRFHQDRLDALNREELDDERAFLADTVFDREHFSHDDDALFQDRQRLMGFCALVQGQIDRYTKWSLVTESGAEFLALRERVGQDTSGENLVFLGAMDRAFKDVLGWAPWQVEDRARIRRSIEADNAKNSQKSQNSQNSQ